MFVRFRSRPRAGLWVMFAALAALHARADAVTFATDPWRVTLDPQTLAVTGQTADGDALTVSSPQALARRVAELTHDQRSAAWRLPDEKVAVAARLEGAVLSVTFRAEGPTSFSWPLIAADAGQRAYILPMFEGLYVPAGDAPFARFLAKEGPIKTTAGLSMPFWGVEFGHHTLTYVLTNPFNNEIGFATADNGRIGVTFAHAFTANQKVKEYGFRIHLGDASPVTPAKVYRQHLIDAGQFVSLKEKIAKTPDAAKLLGAAHVYLWGDGVSERMMQSLADAGLDRAWLGSPTWDGLKDHPDAVRKAIGLGYLIGPYDSFHSIHSPAEEDTWETAQFENAALYEAGAIVKADGTKRRGFKQKGYVLSPRAARPYVEKRVMALMPAFRCNSWFIDCDAFGDVFDDYSPEHPATQQEDADQRVSRMAWIRDTFGAVIGSEGGSAYAAPAIHFAHGVTTPVIGWGDPELSKDKTSKYYLGGYWSPDGPAVFFKQVPMKDEHRRIYADPRFRVPLYQVVFHDSVVATHQWGFGSLKFQDEDRARELIELLYGVPPLYHLNLPEWAKRAGEIRRHYAFFSPLHRETGLLRMSNFQWLSEDRLVQRTTFGDQVELIANFGGQSFQHAGRTVPAHSILAHWQQSGKTILYP